MKKLINLSFFVLLPSIVFSQERPHLLQINSRDENLYKKGFLNSEFLDGKVIYKDGAYGAAKMNFNVLTSEMLFIAPKGDTLKVVHPETLGMITIASDTFCYYKTTFVLKITHNSSINLFQRLDMKLSDNLKSDGYGYSSTSASSNSNSFSSNSTGTTQLVDDRELIFRRNTDFLISDNFIDFTNLKETSIYKMFPKYKMQLKKYFETSHLNFNKKDDAVKLIDFIKGLESSSLNP